MIGNFFFCILHFFLRGSWKYTNTVHISSRPERSSGREEKIPPLWEKRIFAFFEEKFQVSWNGTDKNTYFLCIFSSQYPQKKTFRSFLLCGFLIFYHEEKTFFVSVFSMVLVWYPFFFFPAFVFYILWIIIFFHNISILVLTVGEYATSGNTWKWWEYSRFFFPRNPLADFSKVTSSLETQFPAKTNVEKFDNSCFVHYGNSQEYLRILSCNYEKKHIPFVLAWIFFLTKRTKVERWYCILNVYFYILHMFTNDEHSSFWYSWGIQKNMSIEEHMKNIIFTNTYFSSIFQIISQSSGGDFFMNFLQRFS